MSDATRSRALDSGGRPVPGLYMKNGRFMLATAAPQGAVDDEDARRERPERGEAGARVAPDRASRRTCRREVRRHVRGGLADWQGSRRIMERTAGTKTSRSIVTSRTVSGAGAATCRRPMSRRRSRWRAIANGPGRRSIGSLAVCSPTLSVEVLRPGILVTASPDRRCRRSATPKRSASSTPPRSRS